ncbi:unnamed protein product [Polarella glacialis]|uniref:RZ-type domain-containing protein n=1 Tax=Polarella glacialis TaxID=89957 RepID=A0A813LPT7_POLGL|nr:unnamed protein product [Polarella glacialis]
MTAGIGLAKLARVQIVPGHPRDLNTSHGHIQYACRYLRALQDRALEQHVHLRTPLAHEECLRLLGENGPRSDSGRTLAEAPLVRSVHFVRLISRLFRYLEGQETRGGALSRETCQARRCRDLKLRLQQSFCSLAAELSSRPLLLKSFLPEQASTLDLPAKDDSRSFRLLKVWSERLVFFPASHQQRGTTDVTALVVPICRSLSQVSAKEKDMWHRLGFQLWNFTELQPSSDTQFGEGEQFLNSIFGVCASEAQLLEHVRQLRRDPALRSFTLTVDNLMKMVAVYFRVEAGVPVVLMGESGCGKSAVIRFLARFLCLQVFTLDVHGGLVEQDVVSFMSDAIAVAYSDPNREVWVFLDEINTASCVGLFRELVCDGTMRGTALPEKLRVLAACNPYRRQSRAISSAGLHLASEPASVRPHGLAPLEQLVYAVYPLPASLIECAWDFGMLSGAEERRYAKAILSGIPDLGPEPEPMLACLVHMTVACHAFVRKYAQDVSAVSLRDICRLRNLTIYYLEKLKLQRAGREQQGREVLDAFFVAFCLCYWFRLAGQQRQSLLREVQAQLSAALGSDKRAEWVWLRGRWCSLREAMAETWPQLPSAWQLQLASSMEEVIRAQLDWMMAAMAPLPPGVAANQALKENIFVMVVCIDARVPLITVGKPGSSKSLAMQIIRDRFQRETKSVRLRDMQLPDIGVFPYQCSKHTTAQDIERRFRDAQRYEQGLQGEERRGVVFLDEIGLAERSPDLPLKVLHKLLEMPENQVSFVGLSNWALDAAKMNRCLLLSRNDASHEDLRATATAIVATGRESALLTSHLAIFGSAFLQVCEALQRRGYGNFSGLRDFYAFIKLLDGLLPGGATEVQPELLVKAILRSFSGVPESLLPDVILQPFFSTCGAILKPRFASLSELPLPVLTLLHDSLADLPAADGSAAGARHLMIFAPSAPVAAELLQRELLQNRHVSVTFGSSFSADRSVAHIYRGIAQVKYCMEVGGCVILVHSEDIYESLYDMLNQFYTRALGRNLCRLAIGAESRQCEVHAAFRCIVVADEACEFECPAPLLNRFEKQRLRYSSFLSERYAALHPPLMDWASSIAGSRGSGPGADAPSGILGFDGELVSGLLLAAQQRNIPATESADGEVPDREEVVCPGPAPDEARTADNAREGGSEAVEQGGGSVTGQHHPAAERPQVVQGAMSWAQERLLDLLAPETWVRHHGATGSLAPASRSLRQVLMQVQALHESADLLIFTFAAPEGSLLQFVPDGRSTSLHMLGSIHAASDAQRLVNTFFAEAGKELLLLQCIPAQPGHQLQSCRMVQHVLHMVAERRQQCSEAPKHVVLIMHLVKGVPATPLPVAYQARPGVGVLLLDELADLPPWEAKVLSHSGGVGWWQAVLSKELLLGVAERSLRRLALVPLQAQHMAGQASQQELLQSMGALRGLLGVPGFGTQLLQHALRELEHMGSFAPGWQARITDSDLARAGSFRCAQLRHVEKALLGAVEQMVTLAALGSTGQAFAFPADAATLRLWQGFMESEALHDAALSQDRATALLARLAPLRPMRCCPFSAVLFEVLDGACVLAQGSASGESDSANAWISMRLLTGSMPWKLADWCNEHACRLYCTDALRIVSRDHGQAEPINLNVASGFVYDFAHELASGFHTLGPDQIHLSLRRFWPILVSVNGLIASARQSKQEELWESFRRVVARLRVQQSTEVQSCMMRRVFDWALVMASPMAFESYSLQGFGECLQGIEFVLHSLIQAAAANDIQQLDGTLQGQLEAELVNTRFVKIVAVSLVLPLNLGWRALRELHSAVRELRSRELNLQELGELMVAICPLTRPWAQQLQDLLWSSSSAIPVGPPQAKDLARVRHFFSGVLGRAVGHRHALDLALFLALGGASRTARSSHEQPALQAMRWLQERLGGPVLSTNDQVNLARSLLLSTSPEVRQGLEAVIAAESRRNGCRDHQAAAIVLQALQDQVEASGAGMQVLADIFCQARNGPGDGLSFLRGLAAARSVLSRAADMVRDGLATDSEVATSAAQVLDSSGPLRRGLEVFLAKALAFDRTELARLVHTAQNKTELSFLWMPEIRGGLPPFSMLDVGLAPSCDCLPSFLGQGYTRMCESIIQGTISRSMCQSMSLESVMSVFSTVFLGHAVGRRLPAIPANYFEDLWLQRLSQAMANNFSSGSGWQIVGSETAPDWILMVRPLMHIAVMAAMPGQPNLWQQVLQAPESLQACVLPFMPGDELAMVAAAMAQHENVGVYRCPNGHIYTIGNCSQPWSHATCLECGAPIGGENHEAAQGNTRLERAGALAQQRGRLARPGYLSVEIGAESSRQTWRNLSLWQLRSGRFFLHGLLSLGEALNPGRAQLGAGLTAKKLLERAQADWQLLKELEGCSSERLSEQLLCCS